MKNFKLFSKKYFFFFILLNPNLWWRSLDLIFFRPLRTRLRIKLKGMYSPSYYPKDIRNLWKKINRTALCQCVYSDWSSIFKTPSIVNEVSDTINLAGKKLSINELLKVWESDKKYQSFEPEFHNAAHRFHWLLEKIAGGVSSEYMFSVYNLIDHWIEEQSKKSVGDSWQPYTISERICNWIVIWQTGQFVCPLPSNLEKKINLELFKHLSVLTERLEYPASGLVNNHILNNARALYIGGKFIKRNDFAELGKKIIIKHSSDIIGEGGFLTEASSHYQLLLTRTYVEILNVAKQEGDADFYKWLNEITTKMLSSVEFLRPINLESFVDYPRVGDVSPDIPFDWFNPITMNHGWQALWRSEISAVMNNSYQKDGWYKLNRGKWSVITYSHPCNNAYPVGHGHDDFGSFQLYFQGKPVLIDIGRLSYSEQKNIKLIGTEPEAHNSILLDGQGVLISGHGYKSIFSGYSRKNAECKIINDDDCINWVGNTKRGNKWERFVSVGKDGEISIRDVFTIDSLSKAEGYLYFHNGYKIKKTSGSNFLLNYDGMALELHLNGVDEAVIEAAPYYPQYGVCLTTNRIHWTVFPNSRKFTVDSTIKSVVQTYH